MPSINEYKALDLESAASSGVGAQKGRLGAVKWVIPLGVLLFGGYLTYASIYRKPANSGFGNEDFVTSKTNAPALGDEIVLAQRDLGKFVIPPEPSKPVSVVEPPAPQAPMAPPSTAIIAPQEPFIPEAPQPPQTIIAPAAPPVAVDEGLATTPLERVQTPQEQAQEEQKIIEVKQAAERVKQAKAQKLADDEREKWRRLGAASMINDASSNEVPPDAPIATALNDEKDPNLAFLANASKAPLETTKANLIPRTDALVPQGTLIAGVLETAIQSDLPGMVRAVTSSDVYSFDGRRVLIPAGTRLIGDYKSGLATGQTRVFIVWTRMLRSDGVSVQLGSPGTDELGQAGMTGFVDKHYAERYGSAILLSVVGGATQFLQNWLAPQQNSGSTSTTTTDPITGISVTVTTNGSQTAADAQKIAVQKSTDTINQIAQDALKDSSKIPPTISVDQGAKIVIFVKRDLDFSAFYPDPLKQALRDIINERRTKRIPQ